MTDPTIITLTADQVGDAVWHEETLAREAARAARIPARYRDAVVSVPEIAEWVRSLVQAALDEERRAIPWVRYGPSLLVLGPVGTGKTYQAYGALRALSVSGAGCTWLATTAADMYASLRPRVNVDSEQEFRRYADAGLLVLDDLGAAKGTEWNEEINYRLVNHRYENGLPSLITSNLPPRELPGALGERVASRLVEMAETVVLKGADRRRTPKEAA